MIRNVKLLLLILQSTLTRAKVEEELVWSLPNKYNNNRNSVKKNRDLLYYKKENIISSSTTDIKFSHKDALGEQNYSDFYEYLGDLSKHSWRKRVLEQNNGGSLDELNKLFIGTKFTVPDSVVNQDLPWPLTSTTITARDIVCSNIHIESIEVSYNKVSQQKLVLSVAVPSIKIDCNLLWDYDYNGGGNLIKGSGQAQIYTAGSDMKTKMAFHSKDFNVEAPQRTSIDSCNINIQVTNIDVQGGIVAKMVNLFEQYLRDNIELQISVMACEKFSQVGSAKISEMLKLLSSKIDPFTGVTSPVDPLRGQKALRSQQSNLLSFSKMDESAGVWFNEAINRTFLMLGASVADEDKKGQTTLRINQLLETAFLNNDKAYILPVNSFSNNGVIFQGSDILTETTIYLTEIELLGLDTIQTFDPVRVIGDQTLRNKIDWKSLKMEARLMIEMKPSSAENSLVVETSIPKVVENITVTAGFQGIDSDVAILMALIQKVLGSVELGSLFYQNQIFPCFMSTVHSLNFTSFQVSIDDLIPPVLANFISKGIDEIVSTATEAAFIMYEPTVKKAMPNFFQIQIRKMINNMMLEYLNNSTNTYCPSPLEGRAISPGDFVDFRQLLKRPISIAEGRDQIEINSDSHYRKLTQINTKPSNPYGSLPTLLLDTMDKQLVAADENGMPKINKFLIGPITKANSNESGTFYISKESNDLFNFTGNANGIGYHVSIRLFDATLENLNSIGYPFEILQPKSDDPHVIKNSLSFGTTAPLRGKTKLSVDISSNIFNASNELDIVLNVSEAEIRSAFSAYMEEEKLMTFPLRDVANVNCWLSLFDLPKVDENTGATISQSSPITVENFNVFVGKMLLGVDCVSCTSSGLKELPAILHALEKAGVMNDLLLQFNFIVKQLMEGNYLQAVVDRKIYESHYLCPQGALYGEPLKDFGPINSSPLTPDAIEFLVLSGSMVVQTGAVVVAKTLIAKPPDAESIDLEVSSYTLLDLQNLGGILGDWFPPMLDQVKDLILSERTDPITNKLDLGINVFARAIFLDIHGIYSVPINNLLYEIPSFSITLSSINITGIDQFSNVDILNFTGSQTIHNELQIEKFGVAFTFLFDINGIAEDLIVQFEMKKIHLLLDLVLALDSEKLGDIQLGSILDAAKVLPCFVSAAHVAKIKSFPVNVMDISGSLEGSLTKNIRNDLGRIKDVIFATYKEDFLSAFPIFFDSVVRLSLNNLFQSYQRSSGNCEVLAQSEQEFIDFRDLFLKPSEASESGATGTSPYGSLFLFLKKLLDDEIVGPDADGTPKLNKFIRSFTASHSNDPGSLHFPENLVDVSTSVNIPSLKADIDIEVSNARIENLDSFGYPMNLVTPSNRNPFIIENGLTIGADKPVQFLIHILFGLRTEKLSMRNEFDFSMDISKFTVLMELLVKIEKTALFKIPIGYILNHHCWLATIPAPTLNNEGVRFANAGDPTAALDQLQLSIRQIDLGVNCQYCSSPEMNNMMSNLITADAIREATQVANMLLQHAANIFTGEVSQVKIDRMLVDARRNCPIYPEYEASTPEANYDSFSTGSYEDDTLMTVLWILVYVAAILLFIYFLFWARKLCMRWRNKEWVQTLSPTQLLYYYDKQLQFEYEQKALNRVTKSMFLSESIPQFVRWSMPIIILGNIGLFLSGHLSLGAKITVQMKVAGQDLSIDKFFEFSMGKSVVDIWEAGAKALAALLLLFSGVWPYTKQLVSLYLWFVPPRWVSVTRRGSIFQWLDALAKWSMVDIFVLIMSMVGFWVSINSPDLSFLPNDLYSINLMVIPVWGLYANLLAQLISQISSHFILYYHHKLAKEGLRDWKANVEESINDPGNDPIQAYTTSEMYTFKDESDWKEESLHKHTFSLMREHEGKTANIRKSVSYLLLTLAFCAAGCFVVGFIFPSFQVEYLGIVGIFVELGQEFQQAVYNHSIFSITCLIMEQALLLNTIRDYIGLGGLAIIFVLTAFIVPIAQLVLLFVIWFHPMTNNTRKRLHLALDTIQSWQYAEVYIISVFIATWQFGGVSSFMINDFCTSLSDTFSTLTYFGIVSEEDAQCFYVESNIGNAIYFLIGASIVLALLTRFIKNASIQKVADRRESNNRLLADVESSVNLADKNLSSKQASYEDLVSSIQKKLEPVKLQFTDEFGFCIEIMDITEGVQMRKTMRSDDDSNEGESEVGDESRKVQRGVICDHSENVSLPKLYTNDENFTKIPLSKISYNSPKHTLNEVKGDFKDDFNDTKSIDSNSGKESVIEVFTAEKLLHEFDAHDDDASNPSEDSFETARSRQIKKSFFRKLPSLR